MVSLSPRTVRQLIVAKEIYLRNPQGIRDVDLALFLRVSKSTAWRLRRLLNVYEVAPGRYSMRPTADDILYAHTILTRQAHEAGNPHEPKH